MQCLLREFLPIPVIKSYGVSRGVLRRKECRNTPALAKQNRQSLARIAGRDTERGQYIAVGQHTKLRRCKIRQVARQRGMPVVIVHDRKHGHGKPIGLSSCGDQTHIARGQVKPVIGYLSLTRVTKCVPDISVGGILHLCAVHIVRRVSADSGLKPDCGHMAGRAEINHDIVPRLHGASGPEKGVRFAVCDAVGCVILIRVERGGQARFAGNWGSAAIGVCLENAHLYPCIALRIGIAHTHIPCIKIQSFQEDLLAELPGA